MLKTLKDLFMKIKLMILCLAPAVLFGSIPKSKTLEFYTNASFLSYEYHVNSGQFVTQIPSFIKMKDLLIQTNCQIQSSKLIKLKDTFSPVGTQREQLETKRDNLNYQLQAIEAKKALLESAKMSAVSLNNVEANANAFGKVYFKNLTKKATLQKELAKINEEIARLAKLDTQQGIQEVKMELKCDTPSSLNLKFPLTQIKYLPSVKFNANTNDNTINISQSLSINHTLGNLLQDVKIKLLSFSYNRFLEPTSFYPYFLDIQKRYEADTMVLGANVKAKQITSRAPSMMMANSVQSDLATSRVWETKKVNLIAGEDNEIVFDFQKVKAKFINYIDGFGTNKAYLRGEFEPKRYILKARAKILLNGAIMGNKYFNDFDKNKKTYFYFGENKLIKVKKELDSKMSKNSFFGTTKRTKSLWNYEITNSSTKTQKIILAERLPISQHKKIEVKQIIKEKPNKLTKKGEVEWVFTLKPDKKKDISFGYEVEKPNE